MKSAKMGYMPVGRLLLSMSFPAMLSMLVQALYNVIDSIFIGQYDAEASLTAVNIAMPFQMLSLAFALGIGVGVNAIVSKSLGEGNREKASRCAQTGLILSLSVYILFIFVGIFCSGVYAKGFAEGNAEVEQLTAEYLQIVVSLSGFMFVETVLSKILQATGNMIAPMICQLIGALVNIALDPFFINGYLFFPEMGVRGAAVATVIGQACAMLYVLLVVVFRKQDINLNFRGFRWDGKNVLQIFIVGIPTTILNGLTSITTILMYAILGDLTAKTVLGLYFKVQSFVYMPVFGLNQGAMPIMGYNFGRGDKARFLRTYRFAVLIAGGILLCGVVLFLSVPKLLLGLFNVSDSNALDMGARAFRLIAIAFVPSAFGIMNITMLQSTQNGLFAMLIAVCRQMLFLVPIAVLIKSLAGVGYLSCIWLAYPIAELLALALSFPIAFRRVQRAFAGRTLLSAEANTQSTEA